MLLTCLCFISAFTATRDVDDVQFPYVFQLVFTDTTFVPVNSSDSAMVRVIIASVLFSLLGPQLRWVSHSVCV